MFFFASITIIYSYALFFMGIAGLLYPLPILISTTLYVGCISFFTLSKISLRSFLKETLWFDWIIISLLLCLMGINLICVFGPETAFDATWYHLTFPKIWVTEHVIRFIPGGLFYYSVMPKLGELLFLPFVTISFEEGAKFVQYFFGIMTCGVIYTLARYHVSKTLSLIAVLLFYSNLVVSWESTVAYIDLIRAFFEVMAFWSFFLWEREKKKKWLIGSAIMLGGAISAKVLALGSLFLFLLLLLISLRKQSIQSIITYEISFVVLSLGIVSPWLILAFFTTGNPLYPFFSPIYDSTPSHTIFSLITLVTDSIKLFLYTDDPLSPIYSMTLPLFLLSLSKIWKKHWLLVIYVLGSFLLWYITPRTGGGRFILPYLPVWSLLTVCIFAQWEKKRWIYMLMLFCSIVIAVITIGYRGIATFRYVPVLTGKESKEAFLEKNLNFSFGDFYDIDGYFTAHIAPSDTVLLYGFHNLYYVSFPFIDSSYVETGDRFTHIATQHTILPDRFADWKLIYENTKTGVKLYNKDGKIWEY